jgi:hypothetical protein
MQLIKSLFLISLFIVLTPGIFLTLPKKGSKLTVAVVHGLIFAVVYHFTYKAMSHHLYEGFATKPKAKATPTPAASPYDSATSTVKVAMQANSVTAAALQKAIDAANKIVTANPEQALQAAIANAGKKCMSLGDCDYAPCNAPNGAEPGPSNNGICNWNWSTNSPQQ